MSTPSSDALPPDVDAVEIKLSFDANQVEDAIAVFDLSTQKARARQIWFCERIPELGRPVVLPLLARGLILRVRNTEGNGDSTVKLRGPEGGIDAKSWRARTRAAGKNAKIEGDWAGNRRLVSASLDADIDGQRLSQIIGTQPCKVSRLLSKQQEDLLHELLAPIDHLDLLGPVMALKWSPEDRGLDHKIAAERWQVDDTLQFLELSIRVEAPDNPDVAKQALEDLARNRGLAIPDQQETKTQMVLQRLAARRSQAAGTSGAAQPGRTGHG